MATKGGRRPKGGKGFDAEGVKRRQKLALFAIVGAVVVAFGGLVWADQAGVFEPPGGNPCKAAIGKQSTHVHARFAVYLNNTAPFDFAQRKYDVQAHILHLHYPDGSTLHIEQEEVTFRCFFDTVGWQIRPDGIRTDEGDFYPIDARRTVRVLHNGRLTERGLDEPLVGCQAACGLYEVQYAWIGSETNQTAAGNETEVNETDENRTGSVAAWSFPLWRPPTTARPGTGVLPAEGQAPRVRYRLRVIGSQIEHGRRCGRPSRHRRGLDLVRGRPTAMEPGLRT